MGKIRSHCQAGFITKPHNPLSEIYQALGPLKSCESFLRKLSKDIVTYLPGGDYNDYVNTATEQYI